MPPWGPATVTAQAPDSATGPGVQVFALGVYHLANPGQDVFNADADDVLSSERQRQIEAVTDILGRFRPTKIAVEANFDSLSARWTIRRM